MDIGLLASGNLGYKVYQFLLSYYKINFVLTDKASASIIELSKQHNIDYFAGNPRNGRALKTLPYAKCDVLLSVNYLFLIEEDIIQLPGVMAVNFHGSLLPKYRGRTPHVWAIINNEKKTGITAHIIDKNCDTGDIIDQKKIIIEDTDTGGSILEKYKKVYPEFVLEVLQKIQSKSFTLTKQDDRFATHFGKRTAEDGQINWDWQRERINNWVRAQAKPYPCAFSFYEGNKIKINKIEFTDHGFNYMDKNGTILNVTNNSPVIKTSNGAIRLLEFETDNNINFEIGKILSNT